MLLTGRRLPPRFQQIAFLRGRDGECGGWIGDPAETKAKRLKKQKTDRKDAQLLLRLLREDNSPWVWVASPENRDLRHLKPGMSSSCTSTDSANPNRTLLPTARVSEPQKI